VLVCQPNKARLVGRIKINILSNFAGNAWNALLSLVFVPLYISLMGVEAYGLVGFFAVLQGLTACLDFGLSTTVNREMARFSAGNGKLEDAADLVRTLEIVYWFLAVVVGLAVFCLAPLIAGKWIHADNISEAVLRNVVELMGLVIVFQWPVSFYSGGMLGLQRQVAVNVVTIIMSTLRNVGVLLVLLYVSSGVMAFFVWQTFVSLLTVMILCALFGKSRPTSQRVSRVSMESLKSVWRFAVGTNVLSMQGAIVMQQDKIILSNLVSLEQFGYYSFVSAVAQSIGRLTGPVMTALFPRFSQLAETKDNVELARLFHGGCQLVAIMIFPIIAVAALFSGDIIMAWTGNVAIVDQSKELFVLMVLGVGMNVVMHMPSILQVSHGWLSLSLKANTVAVIILVPLTVAAGIHSGSAGVAAVFLAYNIVQVLVLPHFIHAKLLVNDKWKWYVQDVGLPLVMSFVLVMLMRFVSVKRFGRCETILWLVIVYLITLVSTALITSEGRESMKRLFQRLSGWNVCNPG